MARPAHLGRGRRDLTRHGAVVNILGYSAEIPFPGHPLMASTNAAIKSLLTTLAVQPRATGPRIYALEVGVVRTRARQEAGLDDPRWLTGEQVGAYAADLIAGRAEQAGQTVRYFLDPETGPSLARPRSGDKTAAAHSLT